MFDFADLTVYKNTDGVTTALGCPINSFLLQNDRPLFMTGGGGSGNQLAVPVGLVCMTKTVCTNEIGANEMGTYDTNFMATDPVDEPDLVPEDLYERLMALAEVKALPDKKNTSKKHKKGAVHLSPKKNKTHKKK
jgi:hypothetical protein